ncbi:MAG: hypothetical protein RMX96_07425 [Nostoc sp. ChiSLP02]|nr:hypothetical protein [Nostoc sp. DedSLP05]MDZ8099337.1 hypothetical protein [Nostoc sp. DedSLP01]MDZ8184664.1 hypothetical protein [Nostoc sp. ChiSLP02]
MLPLYDVVSHLVYAADAQDVDTAIVNGRVLMENRRMLTVDTQRIRSEATSIAQRIKAQFRPSNS